MTQKNILIADDDPSIIMIVGVILKRGGYISVSARDGREAHRILQKTAVDLLITDEVMPHITGTEIARWMREREHLRDVPVIMMSAEQNPGGFDRLLEDKIINAFLPKPFNAKTLIELVDFCLKP